LVNNIKEFVLPNKPTSDETPGKQTVITVSMSLGELEAIGDELFEQYKDSEENYKIYEFAKNLKNFIAEVSICFMGPNPVF
jgi:hypothetical protein